MAGDLPDYMAYLRGLRCCKQPCVHRSGPPHHHTSGDTVAPGEKRPRNSKPAKRGQRQVASDYFALPLCIQHHKQLHALSGDFRGWTGEQLDEWQDEQVRYHRDIYEREVLGGCARLAPDVVEALSHRSTQETLGKLAAIIDGSKRPSVAARNLAATVLELVRDRESDVAVLLDAELARIAQRFPRRLVS